MLEKLTERGRAILAIAREQASLCSADVPEEIHVLLALLRHGQGIPPAVLSEFGVDYDKTLAYVKSLQVSSHGRKCDLAEIAANAVEEAVRLDHHYAGPEHLLIALLRDKSNEVSVFFDSIGIKAEAVLEEVSMVLGQKRGHH